jgi:hypothetical protein
VPNFTNQNREFGISMELDAGGNIAAAFIEAGI